MGPKKRELVFKHQNSFFESMRESIQVHLSTLKRLNRATTKIYNGDDVNMIAVESRPTETRPTSFNKKHNLL